MAAARKDQIKDLRGLLRHAVYLETRFGIRDDCRADCESAWGRVIEKMEELWQPVKKRSAAK